MSHQTTRHNRSFWPAWQGFVAIWHQSSAWRAFNIAANRAAFCFRRRFALGFSNRGTLENIKALKTSVADGEPADLEICATR
jgi:hypothetical protein